MEDKYKDIRVITSEELDLKLILSDIPQAAFYYEIIRNSDNESVGSCGIRIKKTDENYYLGNIEYEVDEEYRGNNYAYKACKLLTVVAKYFGCNDLSITTTPTNFASLKIIEKLGAKFIKVETVPENIKLYKQKDRFISIYKWNINDKGEKIK
ncbi:MAG TPA: GNAT family N-acetyltransferase [Bacilli bacterium]|nr:GNAT family N-acetyltransferase [Bacilli bacterium]